MNKKFLIHSKLILLNRKKNKKTPKTPIPHRLPRTQPSATSTHQNGSKTSCDLRRKIILPSCTYTHTIKLDNWLASAKSGGRRRLIGITVQLSASRSGARMAAIVSPTPLLFAFVIFVTCWKVGVIWDVFVSWVLFVECCYCC